MPAVGAVAGLPTRLGKYELVLPLAAGGMARIYIGRATGIGSFERHVVLKVITPERANEETAVQMFLDEARLAASLNHQNVAQVFEVGEDGGIHYLAMEYVHGQDLRALLAKAGSAGTRIPTELALTVVAGAAAGLNHAHERRGNDGVPLGIVHRDVSPSNIMIGYDGSVKLLDFGIAKATQRSVETQSGIIKGKFAYMAPEQCRGRDVDRRSDVFSLGIILYEVSTQHRCFRADSDFDTMHRIVTGDVVRPTRLVHGYPQALEAIVMKALAVDAAQRYQSAALLLEAIENLSIASRMSLSTMGLGRFMRDMFGDVAEPWLGAQQKSGAIPIVKESTVSSTGHRDALVAPRAPAPPVVPEPVAAAPEPAPEPMSDLDGGGGAATILELPRDHDRMHDDSPAPAAPDWDPKSYPAAVPSIDPHRAPPPAIVLPLPAPAASAPGVGVAAIAAAAVAAPQAVIASTRHGYASGGAVSQAGVGAPAVAVPLPRASSEPSDVQLRPNRVLFVGVAIVAIGVIVMIAVALGGGGGQDAEPTVAPPADSSRSLHGESTSLAPAPISSMAIRVFSDPRNADVMLDGVKLGTTPYDGKVKHATKVAPLTVHLDGYIDFTSSVDLGSDEYTNEKIKLAKVAGSEPATPPAAHAPVVAQPPVASSPPHVTPLVRPATGPTTPSGSLSKSCQPPDRVDPYDRRPICK